MKQLKPATLFLAAALGATVLGAFTLSACEEPSSGLDYLEAIVDTGVKKGGGSSEAVAGLNVEFKTQGGNWLAQDIPENFWNTIVNDDATVNLPSAYIKRDGMILLGWYDRATPMPEQNPDTSIAQTHLETENENPTEPAPYLLSSDPVPEEGRFTEKTKLTKSITLYAWWQQLEDGAKVVTFIPYWIGGAQGFKRQALLQADETTYKIAKDSFPKVSGGPEHHHPEPSNTIWWTDAGEGEQFTADSAVPEDTTVYGHWAGDPYTVTFHTNGAQTGGEDKNFDVPIVYPNPATLSEEQTPTAPEGYTFLGWYTEQKPLIQDTAVPAPGDKHWFKPGVTTVTANIDVYGLWQSRPPNSYRVTFKSYYEAGGAISTAYAGASSGYKIADLPAAADVTRAHYTRDGSNWYYTPEQGGGSSIFDKNTTVEEDIIVYAKWTGKTYTVTFRSYSGKEETKTTTYSYPENDPATLAYTAAAVPQAAARPHYTSNSKWYMSGGVEFKADTAISGDITVTPRWTGESYTITFKGNGGSPDSQTAQVKYPDNDMSATPTASLGDCIPAVSKPKKTNSLFDGWYTQSGETGTKVAATTTVSAAATYYAKWADVPSGWTYDAATGYMSKTFNYTTTNSGIQTLTIPVEGGYTFELDGAGGGKGADTGWGSSDAGNGGKSKGTINLPKDKTLYVYVGGKGVAGGTLNGTGGAGGWNGGAAGGGISGGSKSEGGGGGGATDIRFDKNDLNTRIIVAGGGGGGDNNGGGGGGGGGNNGGIGIDGKNYSDGAGGKIGGIGGGGNNGGGGTGGRSYGAITGDAAAGAAGGWNTGGGGGTGGYNSGGGGGGGGGGYWGGGGGGYAGGGGGGSGFVYGYSGTPGDQTNHKVPAAYKDYKFTNGSCETGAGSSGDGKVVVTYIP